jgi:4-hydroxy-3-polyprenylbenzoate decarboxylase
MEKKRIVVGISGASGAPLAISCLKELKKHPEIETHLVISTGGKMTILQETDFSMEQVKALADVYHEQDQIGASIASGSFRCEGMIIVPCSMKTVAGIANGYSDNLLLRAADVMIKEKRRLVLVARETPLSPIHLRNLSYLAGISNITVLPPMLTFYQLPETIEDMVRHMTGKILDQFRIDCTGYRRWNG